MISLLSPLISLQNRQKCRFEPTLKKCSHNKALRAKKPYFMQFSAQTRRPKIDTKRPEVDTLTKRLEMPCPLPDPGFESRTLRHRRHKLCIACDVFFFAKKHPSLTPLLLSPKSLLTFRGPCDFVIKRLVLRQDLVQVKVRKGNHHSGGGKPVSNHFASFFLK